MSFTSVEYTGRSRIVLRFANQEALRLNHEWVGTEDVLLGLIQETNGVGGNVLKNMGVNLVDARAFVENLVPIGLDLIPAYKLPFTPKTSKALEYAEEEAKKLNDGVVGTEHLLLGLLREEGVACAVINKFGIELRDVRKAVLNILGVSKEPVKPYCLTAVDFNSVAESLTEVGRENLIALIYNSFNNIYEIWYWK